jgi:isopentenyldiphosphate isomerase
MIDLFYENQRLLDVIDENDQIIDARPRHEIHSLGLMHREIHVFMFDSEKNVFFQKKGLHKAHAGLLDATVAGHVNKGEDYLEAAVRETEEETGNVISPADLILLEKKKVSHIVPNLGGTANNFIRYIYIYNKAINDKMIKREEGIQGGGFQKFSYDFLQNISSENKQTFDKAIPEELPAVLTFLSKWKK